MDDLQLSIGDLGLQFTGGEGPHIEHPAGILGNVDKAPGPRAASTEPGDVDIAPAVNLRCAQEGHVQHTAVVEVKGVTDAVDGLGVDGGGKAHAVHRNASYGAGF